MTDKRVFQSVVLFLGATLLLSVIAIAALSGFERAVPSILENLAVGSLTGLAGLLARQPNPDAPQAVTVVNSPLAVEEAP